MANQVDGANPVKGIENGDPVLTPPSRIRIVHRMVGDVHVFTAQGVDDFQVADRDLETAFAAITDELAILIADSFGEQTPYVLTQTYREYRQSLYGVHRDPSAQTPLYAVIPRHAHMVDPQADYVPPARLRRQALQRATRGSCQPA